MKILCHRGYWSRLEEKNTLLAFKNAFIKNFGIETDFRDFQHNLVVSHDLPDERCLSANKLMKTYLDLGSNQPLAINVKSDGLQQLVNQAIVNNNITNYFLFDMSVPDAILYLNLGINTFTRQSEYEPTPAFYKEACGVWMDSMKEDWIEEKSLTNHLNQGKKVCIVSPELHNRLHISFWEKLAKMEIRSENNLMLCTDYPEKADEVING